MIEDKCGERGVMIWCFSEETKREKEVKLKCDFYKEQSLVETNMCECVWHRVCGYEILCRTIGAELGKIHCSEHGHFSVVNDL